MKPEDRRFLPVEVASSQIDRVLVAAGLTDSRSEAQRLIRAGGVSWRIADDVMGWTKVVDFKQEVKPGWPWYIRVGNGNWRSVQRKPEDGQPAKPGWDSFPGVMCVMVPEESQTIDVWSEVWK